MTPRRPPIDDHAAEPVDRCVCMKVPFDHLVRLHRETGATLDELRELTRCGGGCGLCLPYVRVAIATGRARLPVMTQAQLDAAART